MSRRIAYLIAQHPAINHTFMFREVRQLRALGWDVQAASIRPPDRPPQDLTVEEREESALTFYVKRQPVSRILAAQLATLLARPAAYLRGIWHGLSLGDWHPRRTLLGLVYFAEAVVIGHWMQQRQVSHIHIHYSSTVGLLLTKVFPVTMSVTFHGPDEFDNPAGFRLAEKVQACLFLCAISFYARSQLMKVVDARHWSKILVAPLGIDPSIFTPRPFRERPQPVEILCVGRLAPVKAQHVLISAVHRLVQQGEPVLLRLAGGGPDRQSLEAAVRERGLQGHVIIEGFVPQERLDALYRQADIFALASFAEGVPGVLMEAMAMEIPCVATRIAGVPELVRDGIDGLLVAPADEAELAEALAHLIRDPSLRQRLGRAGRQRVLEKYNLLKSVDRLAEIFQRYLGPAARAKSAS